MAEFLLELYSEEIPPQLQIAARSQIKQYIKNSFIEKNISLSLQFLLSKLKFLNSWCLNFSGILLNNFPINILVNLNS